MIEKSIGSLIRKMESDYVSSNTQISKYVSFSQYENIEKIEAYLNSKHISGDTDSMGREKPFFNLVTGAVNIWFRATDIDRKDIRIKATKSGDFIGAFLATIHLQEWMKKDNFGMFLNDWGRALARYGSVPVKFVTKKDGLHVNVTPWNRMISDTIDFENNPKIEKLSFTPAQLRSNKAYDQVKVTELIDAAEVTRKALDKTNKDTKADFIELYEIHGLLPKFYLTENEGDENEYVQQMQVVSFFKSDETKDEYKEFTLLKGKEAKDPYMLTTLITEDGRAQGIGAVEHLFEAQWMTNHTAKNIKDQLDLASKLIFQTSDGSFVGQNALTSIETGDILIHRPDEPLTKINNDSHDIASLQSFGNQWQVLAKEITSTPDAISGGTMPSGTAYRQVAILNQESHSLFEIMTENKGLAIEAMMRKYIIPYLKTKMDSSDEIASTLEDHQITTLDSMYIKAESIRRKNAHVKKHMLEDNGLGGSVAPEFDMQGEQSSIQQDLNATGNQRFLKPSDVSDKTWNDMFANLEWDVEVEVTNETSDKEAVMTTLTTVLQTIASNPNVLQDPNMKMLFNKILAATGEVSPVELSTPKPSPRPQNKVSESLNYKDAPDDIRRQIESQAGMKPSTAGQDTQSIAPLVNNPNIK